MKQRLDILLVEQGLAASREKAKAMIMSGVVFVNGQREDKAGSTFDEKAAATIEIHGSTLRYVSRGGLKLEKAVEQFGFSLKDKVCMDVGASTGGFTDCMLQNGAVKVFSVDVGRGQLDWKLRNDERVVCMEKTNMRYVKPEDIGELVDFISIDVSFISLTKILPPVKACLKEGGQVVCLIKPQFEAGREKVGKKGVVRDRAVHEDVIKQIMDFAAALGFSLLHLDYSPIKGPEGNIEYLLHLLNRPEESQIENKQKDINLEITEQIRHHISRLGAVCNIYDQYDRDVSSIDIPEGTQCILVIGGDGTILAAARMLVGSNIPLLGINLGTLGFLADVNLADLSKTLDLLLQDQYQVENRIMLTAEVYKQGEKAATYIALNDFNINRFGASRVIGLKVDINGSVIDRYRADGVIVCTPTGSTGYNLSAGGPIINPTCKNFVITPICPHSLTARSIVLAKEDVVTVEVEQIRSNIKEEAIISFDGREGLSLFPGDQVKIYKSQEVTPFIKATEVSFVQILKEKLL